VTLLSILVVVYLVDHAYRYHECFFPPGIFDGPRRACDVPRGVCQRAEGPERARAGSGGPGAES
jgi:hypothetical protein